MKFPILKDRSLGTDHLHFYLNLQILKNTITSTTIDIIEMLKKNTAILSNKKNGLNYTHTDPLHSPFCKFGTSYLVGIWTPKAFIRQWSRYYIISVMSNYWSAPSELRIPKKQTLFFLCQEICLPAHNYVDIIVKILEKCNSTQMLLRGKGTQTTNYNEMYHTTTS